MAETQRTALEYIKGLFPDINVSDSILSNVAFKAGIDLEQVEYSLTERERDLAYAYLILYLAPGGGASHSVTDRDADWEHSESNGSWSYSDRWRLLLIARALLRKWGIDDILLDAATGKWGFKGTGFHKIRRYPKFGRKCR